MCKSTNTKCIYDLCQRYEVNFYQDDLKKSLYSKAYGTIFSRSIDEKERVYWV